MKYTFSSINYMHYAFSRPRFILLFNHPLKLSSIEHLYSKLLSSLRSAQIFYIPQNVYIYSIIFLSTILSYQKSIRYFSIQTIMQKRKHMISGVRTFTTTFEWFDLWNSYKDHVNFHHKGISVTNSDMY